MPTMAKYFLLVKAEKHKKELEAVLDQVARDPSVEVHEMVGDYDYGITVTSPEPQVLPDVVRRVKASGATLATFSSS